MKITIVSIKNLTSKSGTPFGIATVKNESNAVFENTTIFGSFPGYAELKEGSIIEGELVQNDYNGKTGWKINAPRVGGAAKGGAGMIAAVERKEAGIVKSQDRKEEGIKVSSTMRDAVLIALAELKNENPDADVIKKRIMYWREFLLKEWDIQGPPF